MWPALNLTPPWMTLPSDQSDPTYAYRKALYDFCRRGNVTDYDRLDAILYSEYGDRPVGQLPQLYSFTTAGLEALAAHVFHAFEESWIRLLEDYVSQYKPLENYSMTEQGNDTDKYNDLGIVNVTSGKKKTASTPSGSTWVPTSLTISDDAQTVKTENQVSSKQQESVSTYDAGTKLVTEDTSTAPVGEAENKSTVTPAGTQGTDSKSWSKKDHSHNFSRSGNIGVMTATQMLEADSAFWSANDFFSLIASNIASIVTNPYYE